MSDPVSLPPIELDMRVLKTISKQLSTSIHNTTKLAIILYV